MIIINEEIFIKIFCSFYKKEYKLNNDEVNSLFKSNHEYFIPLILNGVILCEIIEFNEIFNR